VSNYRPCCCTPSALNIDVTQDRMRTMHDGIMIGIGTAMNDNPQLNGAYLIIFRVLYDHQINDPFWQSAISHFLHRTRISSTITTRALLLLTLIFGFHPRVSSLSMRRRVQVLRRGSSPQLRQRSRGSSQTKTTEKSGNNGRPVVTYYRMLVSP